MVCAPRSSEDTMPTQRSPRSMAALQRTHGTRSVTLSALAASRSSRRRPEPHDELHDCLTALAAQVGSDRANAQPLLGNRGREIEWTVRLSAPSWPISTLHLRPSP